MGTDTPIAVLSERPRLLFDYFTQLFAQVTNPPLDAIREELVTSPGDGHRPGAQPAGGDAGALPADRAAVPGDRQRRAREDRPHQRRRRPARLQRPRRSPGCTGSPAAARRCGAARGDLRRGLRGHRARRAHPRAVRPRLHRRPRADPVAAADRAPCTSTSIREKTRTQVGLIVEAGDVREVHHVALLIGYGAAAVNPYLAMETRRGPRPAGGITGADAGEGGRNLVKALGKGVLKVMCKMGISTVASYRGAQVFEAVGLARRARRRVLHRHHLPARRHRARRHRRRGRGRGTRKAYPRERPRDRRTAGSRSAASTSGAARASCTCSTPRPCSCSSTPPARGRYDVFREYTAARRRAVPRG